jgi:hypothetical protein
MPRDYDALEAIRQASTMSQQIVSKRDPEYGWYAGASWEIANKLSLIDFIIKAKLLPEAMVPIIKLYRMRLDQQRKAFFASVGSTEVTKLGFILGLQGKRKSAKGEL